jgi:hypothetical protein
LLLRQETTVRICMRALSKTALVYDMEGAMEDELVIKSTRDYLEACELVQRLNTINVSCWLVRSWDGKESIWDITMTMDEWFYHMIEITQELKP